LAPALQNLQLFQEDDPMKPMMTRLSIPMLLTGTLLLSGGRPAASPNDEIERIQNSLTVLRDLTTTPDNSIPKGLLQNAEAIVVIPSLVKGGFIVGAKHGKGVLSVRDDARRWSSPAFIKMTGGSIGWQIGVESVDLVLLVMNRGGINDLLSDKFTLGGNMSVAAGPVGRNADAATDVKMGSQILAYSRAKGLFAGASLEGASLTGDKDSNEAFYGKVVTPREIVDRHLTPTAPIGETWRTTLHNLSNPPSGGVK
jgi:lipid-binding SYLF domain-containing protein